MRQKSRLTDKMRIAVQRLREFFSRDRYQPHKHYMRGPGPKARAKRDGRSEFAGL
jgi:hypothetical protein